MSTDDRAERRRDEILDAAEQVFANKGFHDAGIADIAAVLKIGHGTFYRYFRNKQQIAAAVLDRAIARIAQAVLDEDPAASETLAQYRAQVTRILQRMFALIDAHPHVMRFFHGSSSVVDAERLARAVEAYAGTTARFLENGVAKGFLRAGLDIEVTAQILTTLTLEGTRRALEQGFSTAERQRWVEAGLAFMFEGIRAG